MAKIQYKEFAFAPETLKIIGIADAIVSQYQAQGFDLTLRQLYYQFVAKGFIPNKQAWYTKLQGIVNDARLAGLLDWDAIVDRTRNLMSLQHWGSPSDPVRMLAHSYHEDLWADQRYRVEVWIEKDALAGVLDSVCPQLDVPYFSCRGYTSQSEMWVASQRIVQRAQTQGQGTIILHMGDHDPSGIDMTRDIKDRLKLFTEKDFPGDPIVKVKRIALTMKQIERYHPPPNPVKVTDSRFKAYQARYGDSSWELDALEPAVLVRLVNRWVGKYMDPVKMEEGLKRQEAGRRQLKAVSRNWEKALSVC